MQWSTTAKEKDESNFFKEMPKILRRLKYMYAILLPIAGGMVYLGAGFAPRECQIDQVAAIVPLSVTIGAHALLPVVMNPSLMVFNY